MHATSAPRFRPPGSYLPRTTGRTRAAPNTQIDEAPAARRQLGDMYTLLPFANVDFDESTSFNDQTTIKKKELRSRADLNHFLDWSAPKRTVQLEVPAAEESDRPEITMPNGDRCVARKGYGGNIESPLTEGVEGATRRLDEAKYLPVRVAVAAALHRRRITRSRSLRTSLRCTRGRRRNK